MDPNEIYVPSRMPGMQANLDSLPNELLYMIGRNAPELRNTTTRTRRVIPQQLIRILVLDPTSFQRLVSDIRSGTLDVSRLDVTIEGFTGEMMDMVPAAQKQEYVRLVENELPVFNGIWSLTINLPIEALGLSQCTFLRLDNSCVTEFQMLKNVDTLVLENSPITSLMSLYNTNVRALFLYECRFIQTAIPLSSLEVFGYYARRPVLYTTPQMVGEVGSSSNNLRDVYLDEREEMTDPRLYSTASLRRSVFKMPLWMVMPGAFDPTAGYEEIDALN